MKNLLGQLWISGILFLALCVASVSGARAESDREESPVVAEDVFSFRLMLKVPQVLNNTESQGYRQYKYQLIVGDMYIVWLQDGGFRIEFGNLKNNSFKIRGTKVAYEGQEDRTLVYTQYNYIGDNRREKFRTACLCFSLVLEPSYAIGTPTEDNSFYLTLAGSGQSIVLADEGHSLVPKMFRGHAAGTQGCGCYDYGHKSPTRNAGIFGPTEAVSDVVATWGTWKATFKHREWGE